MSWVIQDDAKAPVIAKVVDVAEFAQAALDQRPDADAFLFEDPAVFGDIFGVWDAIDSIPNDEFMEVVILPAHDDLNEVMQARKRGRQGDIQLPPDEGGRLYQLEPDAGDDFRHKRLRE